MPADTRILQKRLLRQYYKTAQLGWFHPKIMHWSKIVSHDGHWRWMRTDGGIRSGLAKFLPLHVYQTLLRFKTKGPPRGKYSNGFLLGGPVLFEMDLFDKNEPLSLWKLIDTIPMIRDLVDFMKYRDNFKLVRITYSGFRGIHVVFDNPDQITKPIPLNGRRFFSRVLKDYIRERRQLARAVGYHCVGWDWKVSADIWRVVRVPWSIHGSSSLRAITLHPIDKPDSLKKQLAEASPFSFSKSLKIRMKRSVPSFVFIDGQYYGPYRKGNYTKLPIAVAVHLMWLGYARPREEGPRNISSWFDRGWQLVMKKDCDKLQQGAVIKEAIIT